ncbi:hypothetical protein LINGRAPRIM_LOCUS1302 [Linum grandiflorum]
MASLQFSYAVISLTGRAALLEGLSPRVFVVYRQAIAALTISPVAYFLRYPPPFVEFIDFIDLQLLTNSQLHHCLSSRGKSGRPSIGITSFTLIFLAALIGYVINA